MKAWIPGANGLLGSVLAEKVPKSLATRRSEVDIGDLDAVLSFIRKHPDITHIFNCAAYSLVDAAEEHREEAWRANALGPENLGRAAKQLGARLLHLSTDYVFSGELKRPLTEEDPTAPCNHYGKTKREGEERLLAVYPEACILRTSWIFGRGGKNFVAKLFQMLREEEEIRLTEDQWGRPTYVGDLVRTILHLQDRSGLFHFANTGIATKFSFGCALREELERRLVPLAVKRLVPVPGAAFSSFCKRPSYSVFDTAKIEKELSIRPWKEALREYLCDLYNVSS